MNMNFWGLSALTSCWISALVKASGQAPREGSAAGAPHRDP